MPFTVVVLTSIGALALVWPPGWTLFTISTLIAMAWYVRQCVYRAEQARFKVLGMDHIDQMPGRVFEEFVARLLSHRGYTTKITPSSNDKGVDIVARRNGARIAVQCKRQRRPVSRRAVSDVVTGKGFYHCADAMVITNTWFTSGARDLARSTGCVLVDRKGLAAWIEDFQSGIPCKFFVSRLSRFAILLFQLRCFSVSTRVFPLRRGS